MVGLLLLAGFMALRGDRVGARVVDVFPVDGSRAVSTRAGLRVTFAQEMEAADVSVTVVPDVEAAVSWDGRALLVQPGRRNASAGEVSTTASFRVTCSVKTMSASAPGAQNR